MPRYRGQIKEHSELACHATEEMKVVRFAPAVGVGASASKLRARTPETSSYYGLNEKLSRRPSVPPIV